MWKVGLYYGSAANDDPPHTTETYYFDGDTLINNQLCKKWRCMSEGRDGSGDKLVACLFEEERKVWFFAPSTITPQLLYDFSVQKGATVTICSPYVEQTKCVITEIMETTRNGHELRCVCFADEIDVEYPDEVTWSNSFWMEGIGTTCSPVMNARLNVPGTYSILLECQTDQQVLYARRDNPADYLNDIGAFQDSGYRPLAKEGKVWKYRYNKGSNGVSTPLYYSYAIHGDTVINGTAYKKLYMQHSRYSIYTAALRDEGHNALMVPADSTREFYYYDLELKDSIGLAFGLGAKPHGSTIVNEGAPRRMQWTIWPLTQHMVYEWVEGVGALQDDFFRCSFLEKPDEWDTGSTLIACLEDNGCIWGDESVARDMQRYEIPLAYTNKAGDGRRPSEIWVEWQEGFITVYFKDVKDEFTLYIDDDSVKTFQGNQYFTFPLWTRTLNFRLESDFESFAFAVSNGVAVPEVGKKPFTNPLFDLSGRRLATPPAKGIYIRDGKKILVK